AGCKEYARCNDVADRLWDLPHQATVHGDLAKRSEPKLTPRSGQMQTWPASPRTGPYGPFPGGPMDPTTLLYILAALLVAVGLAGVILPALPGLPLVFGGMLLAAWAGDFQRIGAGTLVVLGLLTALSLAVDLLAAALGARRVGAGPLAVWGAALGALVGLAFGLPG